MDLKNLLYFKTIVEQGQISRAARVLHISQPPLSKRLKGLEDELGVTLIERTGQNWVVTTAGKAMYKKALLIMDLVEGIPTEIIKSQADVSGMAKVGCTTLSMTLLKRFIPHVYSMYPKVELRLIVEDSTVLEHKLREHAYDFCVLLPPRSQEGLTLIPLPASPPCVVVPHSMSTPAFTRAANTGEKLDLAELHHVPLTIFRRYEGGGLYNQVMSSFIAAGVKPNIIMDCPDCTTMLNILEEGLQAIAIVPRSEIHRRMYSSFLVCNLPDSFPVAQPCIALLENRYISRASRVFYEELKAFASKQMKMSAYETEKRLCFCELEACAGPAC